MPVIKPKYRKTDNREDILRDGIEAMVHSIMSLVEVCVRQRIEQFVKLIDEGLAEDQKKKKIKQ